ncbi:MAG: helix-turn-helix domain-containing protein [Cyclobacteriaceae bacterium]
MTALRFILLLQGFLAIFIAGGLFFKNSNIKNRSIAVFILLFGLEIIEYLYSTSQVLFLYPWFYGIYYFPAGFAYGPLLFLHVQSLYGKKGNKLFNIIHFIPALIVTLLIFDIFLMNAEDRIAYLSENFFNRIMPYNYMRSIHILCYGIAAGIFLRLNNNFQQSSDKLYTIAICVIYFLSAVLISLLTWFADGWRQFIYYYLLVNTLVLTVGYLLYSKSEFLKEITKKYLYSGMSEDEMKVIVQKIQSSIVDDKEFLNRSMSLRKIADLTGEDTHRISQTMSVLVKKNFNDYINFYRINYAKELLANPKFDYYKIEAIAIDSGFNNKVTFHKAFVKLTNTTPAAFRKAREE